MLADDENTQVNRTSQIQAEQGGTMKSHNVEDGIEVSIFKAIQVLWNIDAHRFHYMCAANCKVSAIDLQNQARVVLRELYSPKESR